ncbi:MTH1187 family thiamine-binding protein [bacterium]|nr:MTH1187 family thiamine-binding protein [bacterium]
MLVQFTMFPTDKGESVSPYVARILELVDSSGLAYKLGPMSTAVEGEWDEVFALLKRCRDELRKDSNRVYIVISVDDRKGAQNRIEGKIRSVEEKLGKKVST